MTEHEREVAREVEHERAPEGADSATDELARPTSEHERQVERESSSEGGQREEGLVDAELRGTLDETADDRP
jgi:hypothetical protein